MAVRDVNAHPNRSPFDTPDKTFDLHAPTLALDPFAIRPRVPPREVAHVEALGQDLYGAGVMWVVGLETSSKSTLSIFTASEPRRPVIWTSSSWR